MEQSLWQKKNSLARLQSKLQRFRQQVICRKVPHTLISWRFICPGGDLAILLHRQVFLNAWNQHGRLLQCVILVYSLLIWYGWQGWHQVFRTWSNLSLKLYKKFGTPRSLQLYDLLLLAFWHGIPPSYYYRFRLFQQAPKKWFNFIYNHELPYWHSVMAGKGLNYEVTAAKELLGNKSAFAKKLIGNQVAAIPTGTFINKAADPDPGQIFKGKNLFLKPNSANQCRNCYELYYDLKQQDYELCSISSTRNPNSQNGPKVLESVSGQANVLAKLKQLICAEDFLVQPLLVNHPKITATFGIERLVTIRFITGHDGLQIWPLSAVFEVPHHNPGKGWHLYTIDIENGRAFLNEHPLFLRDDKPQVTSFVIPSWKSIVNLALRAHALFPALPTIGWDLAVTDCGPIVIEGNFNWGVNQAQVLSGKPLLAGKLLEIYEKKWV
jgi:hypothetical protein